MGLNHPRDLDAWRSWQRSRNRLRALKATVTRQSAAEFVLLRGDVAPTVLVALDAVTPSALAAVLRPASHLRPEEVAVLAPRTVAERLLQDRLWPLPGGSTPARSPELISETGLVPASADGIRAIISAGHFLAAGALSYRWARSLGVPYCVAQHGLLTPFAPPLPPEVTLFSFSDADGEFWRSGRNDVATKTVGSQLLWEASAAPLATQPLAGRPVFLGQLHGAELSRSMSAATATQFCLRTGASYRPHPAETDRLSRRQHLKWQKQGIDIESNASPLNPGRPVVAVFSTGVLEAAAAGSPAWVTCVDPPEWVREFWQRYGLAQWGDDPTPAPVQPGTEPSKRIAQQIQKLVE